LLQVPGIVIEAISATSSGAMNAAALAQGWARGGAQGARESLEAFWLALSRHNAVPDWWAAAGRLGTGYWPSAGMSRPMSINPLASLVVGFFDMDLLRQGPIQLFVAATRVSDGAPVTFDNAHLSHDALLASACLPQWFPTVVIDGEAYWDGGFAGNPVLEPLLTASCDDLICILLQPLNDSTPPEQATEIIERSAQMAFAAAFKRELRDLSLACQRTRSQIWPHRSERGLKCLRLHMITPTDTLTGRGGHSAADTRLHRLQALRELGAQATETWLAEHPAALGERGSFSLDTWLGGQ
jgi:NTE family protein